MSNNTVSKIVVTLISFKLGILVSERLTFVNPGSFKAGLDEFKQYLDSLSGKESTFNAAHLNKIIDSFAPALCAHLSSEIEDLLALSKYGTKLPIDDLWGKEGKHAVVSQKPRNVNVFSLITADFDDEVQRAAILLPES